MVGFPAVLKVARALMTSQLDGTQDINSAWVKKSFDLLQKDGF